MSLCHCGGEQCIGQKALLAGYECAMQSPLRERIALEEAVRELAGLFLQHTSLSVRSDYNVQMWNDWQSSVNEALDLPIVCEVLAVSEKG